MRYTSSAMAAAVAVPEQHESFEVHASGSPTFVVSNFGFPINVFQITSGAGVVRSRSLMPPGHRNILRPSQHVLVGNADLVLAALVLAKALRRADVELATEGFDRNPERFIVQPIRRLTKVEGDLVIVGPSAYDSRSSNKSSSSAFLERSPTHSLMQPRDNIV